MAEETIIREVELPDDLEQNWVWYADLNIVGLRRGLDCNAKLAALDDMQRWWKRSHLALVQNN